MKSKELIDLIKKADPGGEHHVRITGESETKCIPYAVELVEGYYDGSYCYEEDSVFHVSEEGSKVDIHCKDLEDFVWEHSDSIRDKVKVHGKRSLKEAVKSTVDKILMDAVKCKKDLLEHSTFQVLQKCKQGYSIQEKSGTRYLRLEYSKGKEKINLCQGEQKAVLHSGLFEKVLKTYTSIGLTDRAATKSKTLWKVIDINESKR